MNGLWDNVEMAWTNLVQRFESPDSRLNGLYLISSFLIAFIFLSIVSYRKHKKWNPFLILQNFFDPKVWFHRSALVDYQVFLANTLILGLLIVPFFISAMMIMDGTKNQMIIWFGDRELQEVNVIWVVALYTLILWIVSDFTRFLLHWLLHKVPFLWKIHEVHHSAEVLTPITQYRMHPIEMILFYFRGIFVIGIVSGIYLYYFPFVMVEEGYMMVFGVNIFRFLFLFIGSNLRHSQVPVKFPAFIEFIFISPYQHQIHHSKDQKHFDKNFGSHLAIWDWLFRSLIRSKDVKKVEYGIPEGNPYKSLWKAYFSPFRRMFVRRK